MVLAGRQKSEDGRIIQLMNFFFGLPTSIFGLQKFY